MSDSEVMEGIRALVSEATGDNPLAVEVNGHANDDGLIVMSVRFMTEPERFSFLPLMAKLGPITENSYSNRFGEKSWTIGGQFGGRRVSVSFRVEFLRE